MGLRLYPFASFRLTIFSWRAIASQYYVCPAKPDLIKIAYSLSLARKESPV